MTESYLINITDQQWVRARTYGNYIIAGKKNGEAFGVTVIRDVQMRRDRGDNQQEFTPLEARAVAEDLAKSINADAGDGSFMGVFVCNAPQPSSAELADAEAKLVEFYKSLISIGDTEWERTHNHLMVSDLHRRAARHLGIEKDWAYDPKPMVDCPACGSKVKPGVAVCRTCGAVLDREKALRFGLAPPAASAPEIALGGDLAARPVGTSRAGKK